MGNKMILSFLSGILFSLGALYLAFKNIPFTQLIDYLVTIDYVWTIPAIVIIVVAFILRVVRWRIILSASHRLEFMQAFHPLMIGFMLNCVLPARLGEIARPVIIRKKHAIPFSTGITTVAAERLFDMLFMVFFLSIILATVPIDPEFSYAYKSYVLNKSTLQALGRSMVGVVGVIVTIILLIIVDRTRELILALIRKLPQWFGKPDGPYRRSVQKYVSTPMEKLVLNVSAGFSLTKNPVKLAMCVGLTLSIWGLQILSYYVFALGCPGVHLSYVELSVIMIIICFFIALPSVPGFWGLWEAGGIFAMMLFGVSGKEAGGFTLANHAIQIIPVIVIGVVSAFVSSVNIFSLRQDTYRLDDPMNQKH